MQYSLTKLGGVSLHVFFLVFSWLPCKPMPLYKCILVQLWRRKDYRRKECLLFGSIPRHALRWTLHSVFCLLMPCVGDGWDFLHGLDVFRQDSIFATARLFKILGAICVCRKHTFTGWPQVFMGVLERSFLLSRPWIVVINQIGSCLENFEIWCQRALKVPEF